MSIAHFERGVRVTDWESVVVPIAGGWRIMRARWVLERGQDWTQDHEPAPDKTLYDTREAALAAIAQQEETRCGS